MNHELIWRNELRKLGGPALPERDLWPAIHARIAATPRRGRRWPALAAAAAAVLVVGGAGWLGWRARTPPATDAAPPAPLAWAQPELPALAAAAQDLDAASVQLQQALERRPDAVFLVGLLNRTNAQRMRLLRQEAKAG